VGVYPGITGCHSAAKRLLEERLEPFGRHLKEQQRNNRSSWRGWPIRE